MSGLLDGPGRRKDLRDVDLRERRGEESEEGVENSVAHVAPDRSQDRDDRPTGIEGYVDGEVGLHLHIRIRPRDRELDYGDWCVLAQRASGKVEACRWGFLNIPKQSMADHPGTSGNGCREHWDEQAVFVLVRQAVENGEWISPRLIPSFVRLKRAQLCCHRVRQPWEPVVDPPLESSVGVIDEDGELGRAAVGSSAVEEQLAREVVERGAKVVDDLPYRDAPTERRPVLHNEPQLYAASLRIEILGDLVGVTAEEPRDLRLQVVELALCPPELVTGAI